MALALRTEKGYSYTGSRPTTPVAGSGATTITDAWQKAVATFTKSLPPKHLQKIQSQTTPRDIVAQMKEWEQVHKKTGRATLTRAFEACINRVEKFSAAIDQLAQGSPQPACLLWGCIRFVLLVSDVSNYSHCVNGRLCPANHSLCRFALIVINSGYLRHKNI